MATPRIAPILAVLAMFHAPAIVAQAPPSPIRIETDFSFTANLVHWVDNLAGTSVGKTVFFYQRYWEERFGPMDAEDRRTLESFARVRRMPLPASGRTIANESGCLPVETEGLAWHQLFLSEAMAARSLDELRCGLAAHLGEKDVAQVMETLERFRPRFERVWKDLAYVKRFDTRFHHYLAEGDLPRYLASLAGFFGVTAGPERPMKISFIGLPSNGPTHAEADGDHLLIEIRPTDAPRDQVEVVAHEASHFLMRMMSAERIDSLARRSFGEGEAGALFWRYMWEGVPTALGQGVAQAKLTPDTFSLSRPWYHVDAIDRFAKLMYPAIAQAMASSRGFDDALVVSMTRSLRASPMTRDARASDFLMTAFYASGDGLAGDMELLRRRLGPGGQPGSNAFGLGDPAGAELLRRYACLGGVALVGPADLQRAASMDGTPLLSEETVAQARDQAARGLGVIATGRRDHGGPVYFLVTPRPALIAPLIDAFFRLRGVPDHPVVISAQP